MKEIKYYGKENVQNPKTKLWEEKTIEIKRDDHQIELIESIQKNIKFFAWVLIINLAVGGVIVSIILSEM